MWPPQQTGSKEKHRASISAVSEITSLFMWTLDAVYTASVMGADSLSEHALKAKHMNTISLMGIWARGELPFLSTQLLNIET